MNLGIHICQYDTLVVNYDEPLKPKTDDTANEISDEIKQEKKCK